MKQKSKLLVLLVVLMVAACAKQSIEQQSEGEPPPPVVEEIKVESPEPQPEPQPVNTQAIDEEQARREKAAELQRFLNEYIYFDFDQAILRADAINILKMKAHWLMDHPELRTLIIEGHCDERGTDAYNIALGARRADAVKRYLVDYGLNPDMFQTNSYGEERPLDDGHDEEAWAKNRRAAFALNP